MALTTTQKALQVPGAEILVLVLARPRDPANGDAEVLVGLADGDFWTNPPDALPSHPFRAVFADGSGLRLSEYLIRAGAIATGSSEIGRGDLTLESPTAAQDAWADLDWNGASFEVWVGARYRADGQLMVFSEFDPLLAGEVERMDALGNRQWRMSFADPRLALEEPATVKFFRGFGGAFQIRGGNHPSVDQSALKLEVASPSVSFGAPFSMLLIGRWLQDAPAGVWTLMRIGYGLFGNMMIRVQNGHEVIAQFSPSGGGTTVDVSYDLVEGDPFVLAFAVEADGVTARFHAGEDADDTLETWSNVMGEAVVPGDISVVEFGNLGGGDFEVWDATVFSSAPSQEEFEEFGDGPITDAADRDEVIESWRFGEGEEIGAGPAVCFGEKGVFDLPPVGDGTPTWVSSYEGDDPQQFPGSPAGQTKARTWGPAKNVKLTQVDSQRPAYVWTYLDNVIEIDQIVHRLRSRGVPLVRDHVLTSVSDGQFVFDAATDSVTITTGFSPLDFRLYIPSQAKPARLGQRIKISSTASNNGDRRVVSVSEDGRTMVLSDGAVVDESALTGATIESHPADVQFTAYDGNFDFELPVRVELPDAPEGDLTADFIPIADDYSIAYWSAIHAEISGKSVNTTAASHDPILAYHLPAGDGKTKRQVLDELARAALGWWIETPAGGHKLGTWSPPSGTPVASLGPDRLSGVEPITAVLPVGKFEIAHTPIWHQQSGDALAGSVSAGDRKRFSEPFTIRPVVDRRIRDVRFPRSKEIPRLTTFLTEPEQITTFEGLARPFFFKEPRWYRLLFDSLWPLFILPNDVVEVTWDDPSLELDGTLCRVTGREIDPTAGKMVLEVFWLKDEPT